MSKAEEKALEAYPQVWNEEEDCDVNYEGRCGFTEGYEQAEKDFSELLQERIKTWESIYDENEQFGIDNEQANAVLEELKSLLEEYEKDNTI